MGDGCFDKCLSDICEPYGGNMPLFNSPNTSDATVTIVSESYDDGMKVTRIQTPPRTETKSLIDIIDNVLGYVSNLDIGSMCEGGEKNDKVQSERKQKDNDDDGKNQGDVLGKGRSGQTDSSVGVAEKD